MYLRRPENIFQVLELSSFLFYPPTLLILLLVLDFSGTLAYPNSRVYPNSSHTSGSQESFFAAYISPCKNLG